MLTQATIFDIKRFAVHDGPGIRTTVFLKGCPLGCSWCHNPESQSVGVSVFEGRGGPLKVGRLVTVEELLRDIERDTLFFDESGGGVTFSGGEPLAQPDFLLAALARCGERAIHRTVDTSGYAPREVLLAAAARTELFLYDVKLLDEDAHREHTGVGVGLILGNLLALCETGVSIRLRFPVIPGITDTAANIDALGELVRSLPRRLPVDCLPYHAAAMDKYPRFGMEPPLPQTPEPTAAEMDAIRKAIGGGCE
jgi:pyruvate formate lyase activating enzyme